jgi:hypothetical protein
MATVGNRALNDEQLFVKSQPVGSYETLHWDGWAVHAYQDRRRHSPPNR